MNLPELFKKRILSQWGNELIDALHEPPVISVRINPRKKHPEFVKSRSVPWCPQGYYLSERPVFTLDPLLHAGGYYVQEASSMILHIVLKPLLEGMSKPKVLDLCAAPGGKSTLMANLLPPDGVLVANETVKFRNHVLDENLLKWGTPNVMVTGSAPEAFAGFTGMFDIILADAPCSGEGMFRKDPVAVKEWAPGVLKLCEKRQGKILRDIFPALKTGGYLLYSTCTFNPNENEVQLSPFIQNGQLEEIRINFPEAWGITEAQHGYYCLPGRVEGEGLYFCLLRKIKEEVSASSKRMQLKPYTGTLPVTVNQPGHIFSIRGQFYFLTEPLWELVQQMGYPVEMVRAGIPVMQSPDTPHHGLAMATGIESTYPRVELDWPQAISYLRTEDTGKNPDEFSEGWNLVCYSGQGLGWMKREGNSLYNAYPTAWKIRMKI